MVVPQEECVFGASLALRLSLGGGDPARRLCLLAATLVASSTSSQVDVFCFVLCDSSDRLAKALTKGELVLAICLEHGQACGAACNDVRDLIIGCIHAG